VTVDTLADAVASAMDEAGLQTAHIAGNSLGGYVALQLGVRGRARSVVALAPAGGWSTGDPAIAELLSLQARMQRQARAAAPHAEAIVSTREGRRRATGLIVERFEHIPPQLIAHQTVGVAACVGAQRLIEHGRRADWDLDQERIACPVRIIWGTADKLLPWPAAAARYRSGWLAQAEWVELEGVGHCPQLDVPVETAELLVSFTDR
jgi:pimeloyl-ACP methyl ester carboxylesterase